MRVAVLNITSGGMSGGYDKYLRNIIPRFVSHPDISSLLVVMPNTIGFSNWQISHCKIQWLSMPPKRLPFFRIEGKIKKEIKKFNPDVIFIPNARFWKLDGVPIVIMVRNMQPLVCPGKTNSIIQLTRNKTFTLETKNSALKAERIIAVSGFVRDFLIEKWNIKPERIRLIYHGVTSFLPGDIRRPKGFPEDWDGGFLFTAGSINPTRELQDIIFALKFLNEKFSPINKLAIAGGTTSVNFTYRKKLKKIIKLHNLSENIFWAGQLTESEMSWCYANCSIFIMSGCAEACPNVALEAMAAGCICIAANNPPLPEIFQESAVYYTPQDSKTLSGAVRDIIAWNKQSKIEMKERAKNRALKFSWDITAEKTIEELKKAARI